MTEDICGYEGTHDGSPCQNTATGENGRCYIPTHNAAADGGDPDDVENPQGPPSKFDDVREDVLEAAAKPIGKEQVAHLAGIHKSTLYEWLDEDGERYKPEFALEFKEARAEAELKLNSEGLYDEDTDTTMVKWLSAVVFDNTKTEKRELDASHEHSGEGGGRIEVTFHEEVVETPHSTED